MFSKESRVFPGPLNGKNDSNHFLSFVFLSYMFVMVMGCGAMMVGGAGNQQDSKDHRSAAEINRDATITNTIHSKYVKDSQVNAMDISVSTYRGMVTLRGHVHSEFDIQRVMQIAKGVTGVRNVISRLQIGH